MSVQFTYVSRGAGYYYAHEFRFDAAQHRYDALECFAPEIDRWIVEHVHSTDYAVWTDAIMFRRTEDAFAFRMRWA